VRDDVKPDVFDAEDQVAHVHVGVPFAGCRVVRTRRAVRATIRTGAGDDKPTSGTATQRGGTDHLPPLLDMFKHFGAYDYIPVAVRYPTGQVGNEVDTGRVDKVHRRVGV